MLKLQGGAIGGQEGHRGGSDKAVTMAMEGYNGCLAFSKNAPLHTFFFVMSAVRITPVNFDTSSTPLSYVELHKVLQARPESSPPVGESLDTMST